MEFQYKGLKGTLEHLSVSDSDIDKHLERMRSQTPDITVITNRPSVLGDELVLDYSGAVDGVKFDGGTAQMQTLTLGSGAFIPGFEEQLLNKNPGERVTVRVRFPEQYHAAELAGKDAEFDCLIHEIRTHGAYALDDRFAREVGRCENMAQLRQEVRKALQAYYDDRAEAELMDSLLRQAAATLDYTPTQADLDRAVDEELNNLRAQLAQQGLTLDAYCSFTGKTEAELRDELLPDAKQGLLIRTTIQKIAALEAIVAEDAEIERAQQEICRQNNINLDQLDDDSVGAFEQAVIQTVVARKVLALVRDAAEVSQKAV